MPLTTTGIAIQILSSLHTRKKFPNDCSVNDCKVVVNHLIRKFSEPLNRNGESAVMQSKEVLKNTASHTVRDHAVPVIVLLEQLLAWPEENLEIKSDNWKRVEEFLKKSLLIVEVTREEDRTLTKNGFQREMPEEWSNENNCLHLDPLARYKKSKIEIEV
ncbi:MAG: hypothetical protein JSS58_10725 [Proteobacteria bacterium]|nr:hypothetical protein [Pseudomonadota bacterium]